MAGLGYDGTHYILMSESEPGGLGNQTVGKYSSFNDLINLSAFDTDFLLPQNRFGSNVSIGCLDHDGTQKVFWGGHSGYFKNLDGHLWEIAYNPLFWAGPVDRYIAP